MKKLHIQISQHKFTLESRGGEQDARVCAAAQRLGDMIAQVRREHGFPDSARAAVLAGLLVALESGKDGGAAAFAAAQSAIIGKAGKQIDSTLARTDSSSAGALSQ